MRYILFLLFSLLLIGCNSTPQTKVKLSKAKISSLEVTENAGGKYEFDFKYEVDNFIDIQNTYFCSVHILRVGGPSIMSHLEGEASSCVINKSSGMAQMYWIPKDINDLYDENGTTVNYFIAIYQSDGNKTSHSIANTPLAKLKQSIQ